MSMPEKTQSEARIMALQSLVEKAGNKGGVDEEVVRVPLARVKLGDAGGKHVEGNLEGACLPDEVPGRVGELGGFVPGELLSAATTLFGVARPCTLCLPKRRGNQHEAPLSTTAPGTVTPHHAAPSHWDHLAPLSTWAGT
eukprot:1158796-Pelagomonas_calceolata.AAC.8